MSSQAVPAPEHRARWGPVCGAAFAVILAVSLIVSNSTPDTNKSPAYLLAWYNVKSDQNDLAINLLLTEHRRGTRNFFWFGYLRDRWGRTDLVRSTVSSLLVGAGIFATEGSSPTRRTRLVRLPQHLTPTPLRP